MHAQHLLPAHTNCLFCTQTQPLYNHYCQPDAVQSSLTCSFSLIFCFSLFYCPLFLRLLLLSDSFNFGAAADADGEQAQRVYGQPEGDRLPAQEKRGGLNRTSPQTGRIKIKGKIRHPGLADYLNCINMHLENIFFFFFNHSLWVHHDCLCY